MKTIAIANTKGGCGKTTTAINLAASLGCQGARVLLVDLDTQGHATLGTGLTCDDQVGLYEVFAKRALLRDVIVRDVVAGIDLLPATRSLGRAETLLSDWPREMELSMHLAQVDADYDFVVIDCPAALGLLTTNALLAADELLVPIEMGLFAMDSVAKLHHAIEVLQQKHQRNFTVRILPTMVDNRTRLARSFLRNIWERYADEVLPLMVHHTVRVKEAVCKGLPILQYDADSPATADYQRLAELLRSEPHLSNEPGDNLDAQQVERRDAVEAAIA
ncbi:MAG: ParA family protein [Pseudomonadota bacterium]|nr:MAG: ParA family protein [Pseudomonadota bacterium]